MSGARPLLASPPGGSPFGDPRVLREAVAGSFRKLDPRVMASNPVMFVVEVASALVTALFFADLGSASSEQSLLAGLVALWLWGTVLFANFAEALAEGRGKAQAADLRASRKGTIARRADVAHASAALAAPTAEVPSTDLTIGDVVIVEAGELIPGDGDVIEGVASVDESVVTGESAPVIRESGGDRSAVTGGTRVLSDRIAVRITSRPGETFLDRMIALVEGAERQRTPNEIALSILLSGLTLVFMIAIVSLQPIAIYSGAEQQVVVLVALLVALIPTTIGGLLSAIGIAGMDRLVRRNVLAMSGRAVEAAGDCTTLLIDKTGTVTLGNRHATELVPVEAKLAELRRAALLASAADETPEGRSIVDFCSSDAAGETGGRDVPEHAEFIPFSAETRISGVDLGGSRYRKGAGDSVAAWVRELGGEPPAELDEVVERIADEGATPLVVAAADAAGARVLGVIRLADVVKPGIAERFAELRELGIRTVMITGDNPRTAAAIAAEAGVDDFLAEATPEDKLALIRREQEGGALVAMTGDGTNDAPALAQADVGVAMNSGTQAAKEAGNLVDLDSDPTKLIEIVEIGKQLLITRGALTTFSVANDVAKYFAIVPAMFTLAIPELDALNVMQLSSPSSAILAAVVFNALIIIALVPLALRGVRFRPAGPEQTLRRNLLVFGFGGLVAPFAGIKLIDLAISGMGLF